MKLKHSILAVAAFCFTAVLPTTTRADSLSLVLNPFSYVGQSGGSVTLIGTFTNGAGAITWAGSQLNSNPAGLTEAAIQPIDYLSGGLASGQVLANVAVFTVNIDALVPNGTVFGLAGNSLTIFYIDSTGNESQVDVEFQINVRNDQPPPEIPEPATMVLLGSGLAGLAALKRRGSSKGSKNP